MPSLLPDRRSYALDGHGTSLQYCIPSPEASRHAWKRCMRLERSVDASRWIDGSNFGSLQGTCTGCSSSTFTRRMHYRGSGAEHFLLGPSAGGLAARKRPDCMSQLGPGTSRAMHLQMFVASRYGQWSVLLVCTGVRMCQCRSMASCLRKNDEQDTVVGSISRKMRHCWRGLNKIHDEGITLESPNPRSPGATDLALPATPAV